jgi:hypothetical protein
MLPLRSEPDAEYVPDGVVALIERVSFGGSPPSWTVTVNVQPVPHGPPNVAFAPERKNVVKLVVWIVTPAPGSL